VSDEPPPLDRGRILATLDVPQVRYVLVGGLAAQAYGAQRVTKDLDLCPEWSERNLQLLADALRDLDGRYKGVAEHLRLPPDARLIAGQEIGAWRTTAGDIDVLNGIPRQRTPRRTARYQQLLEESAVLAIDGRQVPVASLDAIIRSKEIVDRPKDREALPELRELRDRHRELDPPDLGRDREPSEVPASSPALASTNQPKRSRTLRAPRVGATPAAVAKMSGSYCYPARAGRRRLLLSRPLAVPTCLVIHLPRQPDLPRPELRLLPPRSVHARGQRRARPSSAPTSNCARIPRSRR
jgi:hypothetical protein